MMENNGMRDIVERLELQAFVADKIQSGMKPLIMDCLEEITHLRCQYEALHKQGEMNARLLTENASLRAENDTLRRDVKTAVMGDSAELRDVKRENEKLIGLLREAHVKMIENDLWVNLRQRVAAAIRESGE